MIRPSGFLRRALLLDALSTSASGLLLVAASRQLEPWLGLSAGIKQATGATFLVFAALVGLLASRAAAPRILVWAVIAYNALFGVECLVALGVGMISPTPLGTTFVLMLAAVVAAFAAAERVGLTRSEPSLA